MTSGPTRGKQLDPVGCRFRRSKPAGFAKVGIGVMPSGMKIGFSQAKPTLQGLRFKPDRVGVQQPYRCTPDREERNWDVALVYLAYTRAGLFGVILCE